MAILNTNEINEELLKEANSVRKSIEIITAYCKIDALKIIDKHLEDDVVLKKLLVRFRLDDIIYGATDFEILDFCKSNGWDIYIRFDLHAKLYVFDRQKYIVGSANITKSGLNINGNGNCELATVSNIDLDDVKKIDCLYKKSVFVTDDIYKMLKNEYDDIEKSDSNKYKEWSVEIEDLMAKEIEVLFESDLPKTRYEIDNNNFNFLELEEFKNTDDLKEQFKRSNIYLWLRKILLDNDKEIYFGRLSAELHNTIVKDPKIYRKTVKELLANLLDWIENLGIEEILIDRPNHSQRIRLIK